MTTSADDYRAPASRARQAGLLLAALLNGLLLWHFHDRYWYPTDDGLYAHVAERLLNGEVLNRDIQDIHPGYIHFLHAAAFRVWGLDLVSLRYPLIAATFAQALAVFVLLRTRGTMLAVTGSFAGSAIGVVQFASPTANWYALALAFALALWMMRMPVAHPLRLPGAGFILGCLTMFRHLSGVWAGMAVLVIAMIETPVCPGCRRSLVARGLIGIMFAALAGYLAFSPATEPGGVVLIAIWPAALLAWMFARVRISDAQALGILGRVGAGAAVASLPMIAYHAVQGSIGPWIGDIVFAGAGETQMDFFRGGWYGVLPLVALYQIVSSADPIKIINGMYWLVLPLLSAVNGWLLMRRVLAGQKTGLSLPTIACFFAAVSLYLGGPLYLYYSAGLSLVSLLWLASPLDSRRWVFTAGTTMLAIVALVFHAGQSRFRTPMDILEGRRTSQVWTMAGPGLPRASLKLDDRDREVYGEFLALIERETAPGDSILALPNDAELYFLAERRNASRFYNSALGLQSDREVDELLTVLDSNPPKLVVFRPEDKYVNDGSRRIMHHVHSRYQQIATLDRAEVFRLR